MDGILTPRASLYVARSILPVFSSMGVRVALLTVTPDGIDAVDLVARGIHRTHYSSVERRRLTVIHKMKTFL